MPQQQLDWLQVHDLLPTLRAHSEASAPIGIFDSGIGGMSVAQEIMAMLPNERYYYFADTAHVPYGEKSDLEILALTAYAVKMLYELGCKAVVVACNTASAFSLKQLRLYYGHHFPIIGLVPALKTAVEYTKTKQVIVLATQATLRGQLMNDVIANIATPEGVLVHRLFSPKLVPFVESGEMASEACLSELTELLKPLMLKGSDTVVLGCTHYPFLKSALYQLFGSQLTVVDSGKAVAKQTYKRLKEENLLSEQHELSVIEIGGADNGNSSSQVTIFVTGNMQQFQVVYSKLLAKQGVIFKPIQAYQALSL